MVTTLDSAFYVRLLDIVSAAMTAEKANMVIIFCDMSMIDILPS